MSVSQAPRLPALGAVRLLQAEVLLLTVLPGRLVIGPLGGMGSPATLLGLGLFGLWATSVLSPNNRPARACLPVRAVLAVFWGSLLISYLGLHNRATAADVSGNADRFMLTMLAFTGVALTAAEGLRTREELWRVVRTAVAGVAVMATVAILQFRAGIDLAQTIARLPFLAVNGELESVSSRAGFNRPAGTAIHPIELGVVLGTTVGFAIHLVVYRPHRSKVRRFFPLVAIGLAIPIAISRSALLAASVVMIYFLVGAPRALRRRSLLVLAAASAFVFVTIPGLLGTLRNLVVAGGSDSSISTRTSDYAAVASEIREALWLGRGPGTFLPRFRILDNQYLLSLVETGLLGLVALIMLFATAWCLGGTARRFATTEADRNMSQAIAGAGGGLLLGAATFDAFSFPTFTALTALWIGVAGAWWCLVQQPEQPAPPDVEDEPVQTRGVAPYSA